MPTLSTTSITISQQDSVATSVSIPLFIADEGNLPTGSGEIFENVRYLEFTSFKQVDTAFPAATYPEVNTAAKGFFGYKGRKPKKIVIGKHVAADTDYAAALVAIEAEMNAAGSQYYWLAADSHVSAEVTALSGAAATRDIYYVYSTAEDDSKNTGVSGATDIAGTIFNAANAKTKFVFGKNADTEFPECAWIGTMAGYEPDKIGGVVNAFHRDIEGVTAENDLTATQETNLTARNAAWVKGGDYTNRLAASKRYTVGGKDNKGFWVHERLLVDTAKFRVEEAINDYLTSDIPGAPPTSEGVVAKLYEALDPFVLSGAIDGFGVDDSAVTVDSDGLMEGLRFTMDKRVFVVSVDITGLLIEEEE